MLGHEDVAVYLEGVALAKTLEGLEEGDSRLVVVEIGTPVMAAEGDEVVVALRLVALEAAKHGFRAVVAGGERLSPEGGVCGWVRGGCAGCVGSPPMRGEAAHDGAPERFGLSEGVGGPPALPYSFMLVSDDG